MNAVHQLLTQHIDIWTTADTEKKSGRGRASSNAGSVYGIRKLRELILELAVRGKLVPQDANDEPASELFKRIQAQKTRLIAEGKIKKNKPLPPLINSPFKLPNGWEWVRLEDIAYSQAGFAFKSNGFNELALGLPLIRIRDVGQNFSGTYFNGDYRDEFVVVEGDYLISMDGEFRVAKWLSGPALLNQRVSRLIFFSTETAKRFVAEFLQVELKKLQGVKAYTTVDHLSGTQISESVIALPPLAEQHRIVAKVDELMALCDQLETQHTNAVEAHEKLVSHLLGTLTQSQDAEDFSANWQRIAAHFDTLFTTEASIDALKKTLLQLAVMGKLVPQDASDEPASVLLNRLAEDAKSYAAKLKIAPPKPDLISAVDLPGRAPDGWIWTRLCSIFRVITDGDHQSPPQVDEGIAFLTIGNITTGRLEFSGCRYVPRDYYESVSSYRRPEFGDILYTVVGATYGRPVFVDTHQNFCVQRHIAILKCSEHLNVKFACYLLSSPKIYEQATQCTTGTAQPTIPLRPLRNFLILLPPLAEQNRIVAKVDELMELCDELESRITDAHQLQKKLTDVLVEQAVRQP
jgi:type I restriction enzyme S subunit